MENSCSNIADEEALVLKFKFLQRKTGTEKSQNDGM